MGTSCKGEIKISVPRKITLYLANVPGICGQPNSSVTHIINRNSGCSKVLTKNKQTIKILQKKTSGGGRTFLENTGVIN